MSLTLFCLLVLTVMLPVAGLLTDLDRASTVRTLAAVQAAQRDADAPGRALPTASSAATE